MSNVFVAGATGVIGQRAVRRLVDAGHQVTGVARSDEKAALLESLGARPVRVDLFDAGAVKDAVAGHEVVVNLTTHIPRAAKNALPGAWSENDRIRREVSRNLVDAALAAGASRYVQESITFGYVDSGDRWITEADPYVAPEYESVEVAEANARRFTDGGGAGVVLRFGLFYDAGSHTMRDLIHGMASAGRFLVPGAADAYSSFIATDDAAAAVVAALDAPAGTYNVVDDEPMTRAEIVRIAASAIGRPVKLLPSLVSKAMAAKAQPLSRSQRVSNAALKEATGWTPATAPNLRAGLPPVIHEVLASSPAAGPLLVRVLLALLVPATVAVGLWGAFAPRSFFDDFPGLGLVWVASDGPYNEHLVRDFGATNLAIAVLLIVAVWKGGRVLLATAAGAYLVYALPHLVYHLRHTGVIAGIDRTTSLASLGAAVAVAAVALTIHRRDMTR